MNKNGSEKRALLEGKKNEKKKKQKAQKNNQQIIVQVTSTSHRTTFQSEYCTNIDSTLWK